MMTSTCNRMFAHMSGHDGSRRFLIRPAPHMITPSCLQVIPTTVVWAQKSAMPGLLSMGCLPGLPQVEDGCFMASRKFNMSSLPAIGGGVDNLPPAIGGGVDNLPEVASGMQSAESILEALPQMSSDLPDMDALHCQPLAAHSQHHLPSTLEAPTEQRKTRKHQTKQKQVAAGKSLWDRPCLRSNTKADIPTIAEKYGQD